VPFVDEAQRNGVKVVIQVGSVAEAEAAATADVDAVIAQGIEARGHVRSTTPIWERLPAAAEAVKPVPVLASARSETERDSHGRCGSERKGSRSRPASSRAMMRRSIRCTSSASRTPALRTPSTASCSTFRGRTPRTECCGTTRSFGEWDAAGRPPLAEARAMGRRSEPTAELLRARLDA
jgi:hypothetical protein